MFYRKTTYRSNHLTGNDTFEGNCIEQEMHIATTEKRPIERNAIQSCFYTRRKNGVLPETDIRTDRWDLAQKAMNKINNDAKGKIIKLHQEAEVTDVPDKSAEH